MHIALVWYLSLQRLYFCISNRNHTLLYRNITTIWLHHYSCHKCFKPSSSAIQELLRNPESVISLVASLTVSSKIWTPLKSNAIQSEQYVFMPAVLLMCCFFDYIFKSCQSFPSIEVCIWSYFMEVCRPTNYNIQLPTCYSLWVRTKKIGEIL